MQEVFFVFTCPPASQTPSQTFSGLEDGGGIEGVGNYSRRLVGSEVCQSERERETECKQAVQSWRWAQCRGGGKCQQRTPPTLSTLRACGVSLVDVVSAGAGEVEREHGVG